LVSGKARPVHHMRTRIVGVVATVMAVSLVPAVGRAQAELQGHVLSETGRRPLANAEVSMPRLNIRSRTDSLGRYRLQNIPRGEHLVITRAVGFRPDSGMTAFDGDEALVSDVVLKVALNELPTVAVRETSVPIPRGKMAAFEERRALGIGHFVDREMLAKDENRQLGDILASNVPGLKIHRGSGSKSWAASGRATSGGKCAFCQPSRANLDPADRAAGAPAACYMEVYLDGALVFNSAATQIPLFNLNSLQANEVEGIEVYTSTARIPAQYNRTGGGCGVMLIWTREPR
jgi:carboxypeptidase-like protein